MFVEILFKFVYVYLIIDYIDLHNAHLVCYTYDIQVISEQYNC